MQTSFMHPPFGFALFYLRSVAPKSVRTADIYWGAVPFLLIQLVMIAIVLAFPQLVGHSDAVRGEQIIEVPVESEPGSDFLLPPEWR
jgi:TRAP-type mannitol/chloroaromatic compound transport system permease large subunit